MFSKIVYKFGGASTATPQRAKAILPILRQADGQVLIVMSAIGKTTNALESIVNAAVMGDIDYAQTQMLQLHRFHTQYASALLGEINTPLQEQLEAYYRYISDYLYKIEHVHVNEAYDQIVCYGELYSTQIFAAFLLQQLESTAWIDARKVIATNSIYRDPEVDEDATRNNINQYIVPAMQTHRWVITQGFIGNTPNGKSVTLGREGSDYTAALMAALLPAASLTIWKDVPALMNADPKRYPDAERIPLIAYSEAIEMAYYGAQVIHPKTIKPLYNNDIPLYIKCFEDVELPGTSVQNISGTTIAYPPIIIHKPNQVLIQATTRNFSFITEYHLSRLYECFYNTHIKITLMQNSAINFVACADPGAHPIEPLIALLEKEYKILINTGVELITVRYPKPEVIDQIAAKGKVLLKQETRKTWQAVIDNTPPNK